MSYIKNKINILNDKKTEPKVYWTILNYFLNIKISSIPPTFANGKKYQMLLIKLTYLMIFLHHNALLWKTPAHFLLFNEN